MFVDAVMTWADRLGGGDLPDLCALIDLLEARRAALVADLDAAGTWAPDGATSMTAWLQHHTSLGPHAPGVLAQARAVASLPLTASAWHDGALSSAQVRTIVTLVGPHCERFAEHEGDVLPALTGLDHRDTRLVMERWRAHADAIDERPSAELAGLHLSRELGGTWKLDGVLDGDSGVTVREALDHAANWTVDDPRTPARRRADALIDICDHYLATATTEHRRSRPAITMKVTPEQLVGGFGAETIDGIVVPGSIVQILRCDCVIARAVMTAESIVLDHGRDIRTVTEHQRRALALRDGGCRYPGCRRPPSWCDGHHLTDWELGGPTDLDNLVLLCRLHHRIIHNQQLHVELTPDNRFLVKDRNGMLRESRPPP